MATKEGKSIQVNPDFKLAHLKLKISIKDQSHWLPWSTECLTLHPAFPSGGTEGQQLQQHRVQSLQRQMANALLAVVQSLAMLWQCQFVVERPHMLPMT